MVKTTTTKNDTTSLQQHHDETTITAITTAALTIHRFVPCGPASLQSDAPGWGSNDDPDHFDDVAGGDNDDDVGNIHHRHGGAAIFADTDIDSRTGDGRSLTTTVDISQNNNNYGPICWKCRGQKQIQGKSAMINNDGHRRPPLRKTCPICHGNGRLPLSDKRQQAIRLAKHNESVNGSLLKCNREGGVIKRARQNPPGWKPFGPMAYALLDADDDNHRNNNDDNDSETDQDQIIIKEKEHWKKLVWLADSGTDCPVWLSPEQGVSSEGGDLPNAADDTDPRNASDACLPTIIPKWIPRVGEQLVKLIGYWRILQRIGSHRWTTDDLVTAYVASQQLDKIIIDNDVTNCRRFRYLDLGCGNGSVLQMVSWSILKHMDCMKNQQHQDDPKTVSFQGIGVEARQEAVALSRRSLEFNVGPNGPIQVIHGDFRSLKDSSDIREMKFDLITGTPPYFRVDFTVQSNCSSSQSGNDDGHDDNNIRSSNSNGTAEQAHSYQVKRAIIREGGMPTSIQSAPARCEFRGGIEAYCDTAAQFLKPETGVFVVCENYLNHQRAKTAANNAGFAIVNELHVEGCVDRGTLFIVYVMKLKQDAYNSTSNGGVAISFCKDHLDSPTAEEDTIIEHLAVREISGKWTDQYLKTVFAKMSIPGPCV